MNQFADKVAVVTGAGSGFGREFARLGTKFGMRRHAACARDVQQDALAETLAEVSAADAQAIARRVDVHVSRR
ncbi:SDR family NAD(P)-dependent oxidoreductase [Paraburkholderia sp. Ac-20342]|uniref:SDR family NAD(P)-dependent oxidoreductase n=1 Tax=Paraburkholderia sp. Ac-20342 TaxID=2703889 RepID=UPI001980BB29|nr:SDR family NAD(P)-dependent oxidoreductase [Paraburkholderia sp. Ac-20342]